MKTENALVGYCLVHFPLSVFRFSLSSSPHPPEARRGTCSGYDDHRGPRVSHGSASRNEWLELRQGILRTPERQELAEGSLHLTRDLHGYCRCLIGRRFMCRSHDGTFLRSTESVTAVEAEPIAIITKFTRIEGVVTATVAVAIRTTRGIG